MGDPALQDWLYDNYPELWDEWNLEPAPYIELEDWLRQRERFDVLEEYRLMRYVNP